VGKYRWISELKTLGNSLALVWVSWKLYERMRPGFGIQNKIQGMSKKGGTGEGFLFVRDKSPSSTGAQHCSPH
jgi:hypothetical protein